MLRNNSASGLLPGKHQNQPSGRPWAGRRADFGVFLVSGPEALLRDIEYLTCRIFVETRRNRPSVARNRCVPVCGHRSGHFWRGFVRLGGRLRFPAGFLEYRGLLFTSAETKLHLGMHFLLEISVLLWAP